MGEGVIDPFEFERNYIDKMRNVYLYGSKEVNRTGIDAYTLFNQQLEFDFQLYKNKLPVITGKQIFFEKAYGEFTWMWLGMSNISFLHEHGIHWWDEYADENGDVYKSYGYQLRRYNGNFDQIDYCINQIDNGSRRAYLTFWNPSDLKDQNLPCCYTGMTFVEVGEVLNMKMDFRSSDMFLGLPYDFIVGALFLSEMCKATNKTPGIVTYSLANAHVYENHVNAMFNYTNKKLYELPNYYNGNKIYGYDHGPLINAKLNN